MDLTLSELDKAKLEQLDKTYGSAHIHTDAPAYYAKKQAILNFLKTKGFKQSAVRLLARIKGKTYSPNTPGNGLLVGPAVDIVQNIYNKVNAIH